jgi:hypothetical protein
MGDLSREQVDYTSEVDDLFDEQVVDSEEFEDISISSCVYEPVLIGLKDKELESRLEKAFYPQYDSEIFVKDADGNSLILPIEDIQYLAFVNKPLQIDVLNINNFSEVLETIRGDSFNIRVPDGQDFEEGLFGITTESGDRYKYIFFNFNNIRNHYQERRIGEIIIEKRLLSEDVLQNVLHKQNYIRSLRLGSIIAKKANLPPQDVEKTLEQARQKEPDSRKLHSGDILIEAGLVSPQEVNQSLAIQKKMRRMKVGTLLVDMGYINDDQMYKVLAEKFRKRYVNIENISPTDEALDQLPRDIAKKLKVLPIYFQNKRLIIATSFPDKVELSDILKKKLSCPFELVVSPLNQIIDGLANLPS